MGQALEASLRRGDGGPVLVGNDETKKQSESARDEISAVELAARASSAQLQGHVEGADQEAAKHRGEKDRFKVGQGRLAAEKYPTDK